MLNQWKLLPPITRWLLVTLLILAMTAGSVLAYKALTAEIEVTVEECLDFVGPSSFQVLLYPGETETVQITISNISSVSLEVDLISTVTGGAGGLTVDIPKKITIVGKDETTVSINMLAHESVAPGNYLITIDFER